MSGHPVARAAAWIVPDTRVVYTSSPGHDYLGTVATEPRLLRGETWVVCLRDMDPHYHDGARSHVPAAACDHLRPASAFDVEEFEKRVPLTPATPIRHFACCICGTDIACPMMTTPDPECPEMLQLPPGAWNGLYFDHDGAGKVLHVCGRTCLDKLMAEGWCG